MIYEEAKKFEALLGGEKPASLMGMVDDPPSCLIRWVLHDWSWLYLVASCPRLKDWQWNRSSSNVIFGISFVTISGVTTRNYDHFSRGPPIFRNTPIGNSRIGDDWWLLIINNKLVFTVIKSIIVKNHSTSLFPVNHWLNPCDVPWGFTMPSTGLRAGHSQQDHETVALWRRGVGVHVCTNTWSAYADT